MLVIAGCALAVEDVVRIMVTHDEELARQAADRIIRLKEGQVIE